MSAAIVMLAYYAISTGLPIVLILAIARHLPRDHR